MEQRTDEFTQARSKLAGDIKTVITDGEDLIKAAAHKSEAGLAAARSTLDEQFGNARARLAEASRPAIAQARRTAEAADGYVHSHPWTMIGTAAAVGALIGFLVAKR